MYDNCYSIASKGVQEMILLQLQHIFLIKFSGTIYSRNVYHAQCLYHIFPIFRMIRTSCYIPFSPPMTLVRFHKHPLLSCLPLCFRFFSRLRISAEAYRSLPEHRITLGMMSYDYLTIPYAFPVSSFIVIILIILIIPYS